ncbi:MAG TPA: hypothetical protein VGM50_08000, partial [Gemmatimonadaceae bacterium]
MKSLRFCSFVSRVGIATGFIVGAVVSGCSSSSAAAHHAFLTRLGNDTIAVENISRSGNRLTSDEVDRF